MDSIFEILFKKNKNSESNISQPTDDLEKLNKQ